MKNEKYIKDLLEKFLGQEGVFRQFEFCSWGMETRPDYVILYPNKFVYYEIKSEHDTLARLEKQITSARYLFHEMYLVAPEKMILKAEKEVSQFSYYCGTMALEDLEQGKIIYRTKQYVGGHVSPTAVANILWADERRKYLKNVHISINGKEMTALEKYRKSKEIIELTADSVECLRLLNEALPSRHYNYRRIRENK